MDDYRSLGILSKDWREVIKHGAYPLSGYSALHEAKESIRMEGKQGRGYDVLRHDSLNSEICWDIGRNGRQRPFGLGAMRSLIV